ncbi:acyltransferase [Paenibacillus methanolicus]|uniref:Peptidoglycan/LPS O-acetylase OafA/YrhL n=1 Tax=Paenibacillus methanolicus TaxID=582686 RepID=A0A5S5BQ05_9BACL|nr:acyltransferase [Paenibacillus methanolicus]TYP69209.1 peptidoglycan/LPS O-acetylase OafA/YrhL [Paenibacillus methanolicus]
MSRNENVNELNVLRAIAILGVLAVHATSASTLKLVKHDSFVVYNIINTLALFCVPAFVFLTGFTLFYHYGPEKKMRAGDWGAFYFRKLPQLIIPYVVFSALYQLAKYAIASGWTFDLALLAQYAGRFGANLRDGTAYPHLYYILVAIQLYVMFPLFYYCARRWPRIGIGLLAIGFAIQWFFFGLHRLELHLPNKGTFAFTYFAPFMLGAFAGMYYPRFKAWVDLREGWRKTGFRIGTALLWTVWTTSALTYIAVWHITRINNKAMHPLWYEAGYNVFTFTSVLVLLQMIYGWARKGWNGRTYQTLELIGTLSFGIYLIHPGMLLLYRKLSPGIPLTGIYHAWIAGGFIFALMGSVVVLLLAYRFIPGASVMLGKVPKKLVGRRYPSPASIQAEPTLAERNRGRIEASNPEANRA